MRDEIAVRDVAALETASIEFGGGNVCAVASTGPPGAIGSIALPDARA